MGFWRDPYIWIDCRPRFRDLFWGAVARDDAFAVGAGRGAGGFLVCDEFGW